MGDVNELGNIVAGAFALPDQAGHGEYLPLVGDFMSFNEIVDTLNRQGHKLFVRQVPGDGFPTEIANTFRYFQADTYLGVASHDRIALANRIAGRPRSRKRRNTTRPRRISVKKIVVIGTGRMGGACSPPFLVRNDI